MPTVAPRLRFREPRQNLPGRKGVATAEDRFTIAFARCYLERYEAIHSGSTKTLTAVAREVPVNGYGIADMMVVAWEPGLRAQPSLEAFLGSGMVTTRAFECKLSNWRSALIQAVRYRYFAHQAIVVLPPRACQLATRFLSTFRQTCVGLWEFDATQDRIRVHHTPRAMVPKSRKYLVHAVRLVHRAVRSALPIP